MDVHGVRSSSMGPGTKWNALCRIYSLIFFIKWKASRATAGCRRCCKFLYALAPRGLFARMSRRWAFHPKKTQHRPPPAAPTSYSQLNDRYVSPASNSMTLREPSWRCLNISYETYEVHVSYERYLRPATIRNYGAFIPGFSVIAVHCSVRMSSEIEVKQC